MDLNIPENIALEENTEFNVYNSNTHEFDHARFSRGSCWIRGYTGDTNIISTSESNNQRYQVIFKYFSLKKYSIYFMSHIKIFDTYYHAAELRENCHIYNLNKTCFLMKGGLNHVGI